jgi:hypothetical protein
MAPEPTEIIRNIKDCLDDSGMVFAHPEAASGALCKPILIP